MCYFHQYAYHANGHTIHLKVQLMDYGNVVDDSPIKLGGAQKIVIPCGITMPLDVIRGIAYLKLRHPTDDELATLEPVHMTRDEVWEPNKYDSAPSADEAWFAAIADSTLEPMSFDTELLVDCNNISAYVVDSTATPRDYKLLRPYFLGIPSAAVKRTYDATTQYYSNFSTREGHVHMYKKAHFRPPIFFDVVRMFPQILCILTLQHGEVSHVCSFLLEVTHTISVGTNVGQMGSLRESFRMIFDFMGLPTEL